VPEVTDEMLVRGARNERHLALLRSLGIKSVMIVPLSVRDRVFGAISLVTDRSGRRYTEDDLSLADDLAMRAGVAVENARLFHEAQEALRLREEFLSIASHELKTPLTALQLQAQMLRRISRSGERDADGTERVLLGIERQVKRLSRLTTDLLDVSRIAAGRFTLERSEIDLSALVESVAGRFDEELAAARAWISLRIQPGVSGQWDRHRLDQVASNLISNAIKYGRGSTVEVELSGDGREARLVVADRGIGIAADDLRRIFERFERVETSERTGGLGLGLFIVREIVEAHGGRVWAESEPDGGARFIVQLPHS
jgi:signal transduction histidine kinase